MKKQPKERPAPNNLMVSVFFFFFLGQLPCENCVIKPIFMKIESEIKWQPFFFFFLIKALKIVLSELNEQVLILWLDWN